MDGCAASDISVKPLADIAVEASEILWYYFSCIGANHWVLKCVKSGQL